MIIRYHGYFGRLRLSQLHSISSFHLNRYNILRLNDNIKNNQLLHLFRNLSSISEKFNERIDTALDERSLLSHNIISKEDDESMRSEMNLEGLYDPNDEKLLTEEEGSDPNPQYRIGKHLLRLSKVHYRHIYPLPLWFEEKQKLICNYRTKEQIRRTLKNWMVENDREFIKLFASKPLVWKTNEYSEKTSSEEEDSKTTRVSTKVLTYGPEETVAYSHYFLPSRYAIAERVLSDLKIFIPNFTPKKVIDFGCGPGTAGACVKEIWNYGENSKFKYVGVDMSRSMLDAAKIMLDQPGIDFILWDKIGDVVKRMNQSSDKIRYDLAFISYTLTELASDAARRAAVQIMFEMLDIGGCLVLVETGNAQGSHAVRTGRQFILDNFNSAEIEENTGDRVKRKTKDNRLEDSIKFILDGPQGFKNEDIRARVIAPCTHDQRCPLSNGAQCNFSQKVLSGMIRKGSEEKFSYVVIQKVLASEKKINKDVSHSNMIDPWISQSFAQIHSSTKQQHQRHPSPQEVLSQYLKCETYEELDKVTDKLIDEIDWDGYNPIMRRLEWSRVLRTPIKSKGHITLDLCTPNGEIIRSTFSRSKVINVPSMFVALRKTSWGGIFPSNILDKDDNEFSPLTYSKKDYVSKKHAYSRTEEELTKLAEESKRIQSEGKEQNNFKITSEDLQSSRTTVTSTPSHLDDESDLDIDTINKKMGLDDSNKKPLRRTLTKLRSKRNVDNHSSLETEKEQNTLADEMKIPTSPSDESLGNALEKLRRMRKQK